MATEKMPPGETGDQATGDQEAGDKATGDKATGDKATGDKVTGNRVGHAAEEEKALAARLAELSARLEASGAGAEARPAKPSVDASGYGVVARFVSELVGGALVGAVMGWGLDRLFSTSPVFLVVFVLLGFGAGVLAMIRSANRS